jgi:hypothetical protein
MNLLLAAVAGVTAAAQPAAPPPADPAAVAAAQALVDQMGLAQNLKTNLDKSIAQMRSGVVIRAMIAQQSPNFPQVYQANKASFDAAFAKAGAIQAELAEKVVRENSPIIAKGIVQAYARTYTAAELKGLSDFYKTPLGQSFRTKQPLLEAQIGVASQQLIGGKLNEAMNANKDRISAALAPLNAAKAPAAAAGPPPKK